MEERLDDATEAAHPDAAQLDRMSARALVALMSREDGGVAAAVAAVGDAVARAVEAIAARWLEGGRLVYVGAGTSGRLGALDAAECPPTFGTPPGRVVALLAGGPAALQRAVEGAEDDAEAGARDLAALAPRAADVVVGIAASGRTPYVLGAVAHARAAGAFTVGLSCNPAAPLARAVDLAITPLVGPEVVRGSTRLKAGTATKMVLNMLSTGAMVRAGKTFGDLMVDLQARNAKLRARALRIVRELTALDAPAAAALLQRCGGEVKTSVVAHRRGVSPDEARALLAAVGGRVREVLREA